jgi:hypothetical protein
MGTMPDQVYWAQREITQRATTLKGLLPTSPGASTPHPSSRRYRPGASTAIVGTSVVNPELLSVS